MLSKLALKYVLLSLREAHATYQCPLVWSNNRKRCTLDGSLRYCCLSRIVLGMDLTNLAILISFATANHVSGLDLTFTLILLALAVIYIHSICVDANAIWFGPSYLYMLNSFMRLTTLPG